MRILHKITAMEAKRKVRSYTKLEYLETEQREGVKYEYDRGSISAMAGGSINHGLLCGNVYSELRGIFRQTSTPCTAFNSDIKLYIAKRDCYVYPDTMVVCGDIQETNEAPEAVTNPIVVVEVLFKNTADYDRGEKFQKYRQVPSLQEYVLVEQYKVQVEVYYRKPDLDLWKISTYAGFDSAVRLESLGIEVKMGDLYVDVRGLE